MVIAFHFYFSDCSMVIVVSGELLEENMLKFTPSVTQILQPNLGKKGRHHKLQQTQQANQGKGY